MNLIFQYFKYIPQFFVPNNTNCQVQKFMKIEKIKKRKK